MNAPHPDTLRLFSDPAYRQPDHADVRAVFRQLAAAGHTEDDVAKVAGVSDGRSVRRWMEAPGVSTRRRIKYAEWRLMVLEAGLARQPRRRQPTRQILEPAQDA